MSTKKTLNLVSNLLCWKVNTLWFLEWIRVSAELACWWLPMDRNLVWSRQERNQRDVADKWRGWSHFSRPATLGTTSPDLSRIYPNSSHSPSVASKFHAESTVEVETFELIKLVQSFSEVKTQRNSQPLHSPRHYSSTKVCL